MIKVIDLIEHLSRFPNDAIIDEEWFYGGGDCDCDLKFLIKKDGKTLGDLNPLHVMAPYFQEQLDMTERLQEALEHFKLQYGTSCEESDGHYDSIYVWTDTPNLIPKEFMGFPVRVYDRKSGRLYP